MDFRIKGFQHCMCLILCTIYLVQCVSLYEFEKVGNFAYYIGEGDNASVIFYWFDARQECRSNGGQLVSVVSETQMNDLQKYIIDRRYANGSRFFTSGHSFHSPEPFKWDALQESVDYSKWLPGEGPKDSSFLSLQLIDSQLFMVTSLGFYEYYICEYETRQQKLCKILKTPDFYIPSVAIILAIILALKLILKNSKRKAKEDEQALVGSNDPS
ncbi:uncharacterized protein LOC26528646 [Drosophila mojavensis]|uniref:C-type lectin domain-containing protein n=1 Tax=Drosophila mojavensis TaxID=7230 RepID=A0A0Q9XF80_DROMO|nr:uncharacterized protein LOC26528646 [Drosophila mojavensis]KRG02801.1 uncharacterized protein Dmoj_GI27005 [Drosophila mojavensis]